MIENLGNNENIFFNIKVIYNTKYLINIPKRTFDETLFTLKTPYDSF